MSVRPFGKYHQGIANQALDVRDGVAGIIHQKINQLILKLLEFDLPVDGFEE